MWPYFLGGGVVGLLAICGWWFWNRRKQRGSRLISFVALLREPQTMEPVYLKTAAFKAWRADLGDSENESEDGFVVGEEFAFFIQFKNRTMIVNNFAAPYMENPEKAAATITDIRLRSLVAEHRAWLSCDALGLEKDFSPEDLREWYRLLGHLLAELIDDNCLAIYLPETDQLYAYNDETLRLLKADDPQAAMSEEGGEVPIVEVPDDSPEMIAAVAEAKRRWPEFVKSFEDQAGHNFSVKAPITRNECTEFIWLEVTGMENGVIFGKLGNEPMNLPGLKLGSRVKTTEDEINDWGYLDASEEFVGGFTVKVVFEVAQRLQKDRNKKST